MNGVLLRAKMTRLASPPRRLKWPCPTLQGQNVYVSCPRRIRFTLETYTLCSRYVYVLMRKGIRSAHATDKAGTLSEGEGRAKVQALREGSIDLLASEGYSKPPAGATRTSAGGFALAGVIQERERQGATYASEYPWHSGAHPYPRWRHRRSRSSSASRGYSTRS